jgi:uncharacterized RDD family membrane protein YckC
LSTFPSQANVSSSWKQEVNQRVAAHKNRKTSSPAESAAISEAHHSASTRAAAAAARVAARYANAPSYSQILASEARAAVRAAEVASKAAFEAQAAAESVLAGLEAASATEPAWELQPLGVEAPGLDQEEGMAHAATTSAGPRINAQASAREGYEIRWETDMPARKTESAAVRATRRAENPEPAVEDWSDPAWTGQSESAKSGAGSEPIETVEPGQPIHANLIEFPREIVAPRKVRPRLAEGPHAASVGQLSIFEVDPGSISVEPVAADALDEASVPSWTGPEWSGIELGAQPGREFMEQAPLESLAEPELRTDAAREPDLNLQLAPVSLRLLAAVVNGSLVLGAFLVAALVAASTLKHSLPVREVEVVSVVTIAVIAGLYHGLFYAFAKSTPGMRYAGVALCTFDGRNPTREQRFRRLTAMLVSVVPMGLGLVWAIFDDDHLSWHDRLSQTYLRKV